MRDRSVFVRPDSRSELGDERWGAPQAMPAVGFPEVRLIPGDYQRFT